VCRVDSDSFVIRVGLSLESSRLAAGQTIIVYAAL
jgi:hypothetical protein